MIYCMYMFLVIGLEFVMLDGDWLVGIIGRGLEILIFCVVVDGVGKRFLKIKVEKVLGFCFM